jgi:signal transduction histidine kinase
LKTVRNKRSLFSKLIQYFLVFTGLVLALFIGIYELSDYLSFQLSIGTLASQLKGYVSALSKGSYSSVPVLRLFPEATGAEIVDADGSPVYTYLGDPLSFTAGEMDILRDLGEDSYTSISYYQDSGASRISISVEYQDSEKNRFYLLDDKLKVISSNDPTHPSFTRQELAYMDSSSSQVWFRYRIPDAQGQSLLLRLSPSAPYELTQWRVYMRMLYGGIAVAYLILLICFALFLRRKIRKPLVLLEESISEIADGRHAEAIEYHGPREFESIVNEFNEMSVSLEKSREKEAQLQEEKQKMLSDISHDLKTPITVIRGYSEALNSGVIPESEVKPTLQRIDRKAVELNELIEQFAEYSKLQRADYAFRKERLEITEYLRKYLAYKYDEIELKGMKLDADINMQACWVLLDGQQFRRALNNIVDNALKHNPKNTTIRFAAVRSGSAVEIRIEDDGVGIPPEIAETIFQPFVVTNASRNTGGSGLGLSIAQKIINDHEGSIQLAEPTPGYHTCFLIRLETAGS